MIQQSSQGIPCSLYDKNVTIYRDSEVTPKAVIFYIHGGGLLYGSREDLPSLHIEKFTSAGYMICALDYPLSPAAKIEMIRDDLCDTINYIIESEDFYPISSLPYVLFGRSAGAYLSLLTSVQDNLCKKPSAILSYYGYGFLTDEWYQSPARFYTSLPKVPESSLNLISNEIHAYGDLDTHYSVYVYARQTGRWKELFFEGRDKFFFLDYSLRLKDSLPCPAFFAHSISDPDVPYAEFQALTTKYGGKRFIASKNTHDFDRMTDDPITTQLLEESVAFLEQIFH